MWGCAASWRWPMRRWAMCRAGIVRPTWAMCRETSTASVRRWRFVSRCPGPGRRMPPCAAVRRDLVRNHGKLSDVLLESGQTEEAMQHSRKLLGLAALDPGSLEDQRNLASAYVDIGWNQVGKGDEAGG